MGAKIFIGGIAFMALLVAGYLYLDGLLFDGVKPREVSEKGFKGTLFAKNEIQNRPAIVLVGGGDWGDYWGQEFAKANYAGLSLPYYRMEGLPERMEEIPLEYFEKAISWLQEQPEVNRDKVVVMGASRNAELALLVASYYPELVDGVIAYSPSAVSWSNTVLPFNSDEIKPSWTFNNKPVPYIAMAKLRGGETDIIETLPYWRKALADSNTVRSAAIPVENINGPILLLSGRKDAVWPSAMMSDMIANRIGASSFGFPLENIQYDNAGHLLSVNPNNSSPMRHGRMMVDGKEYSFSFGGTEEGNRVAREDALRQVFNFLSAIASE
ncbi:acyl-CoA thioester hydrolase/BAAT C-terminal domain-containing protein [Roseivirga sp. BDSF3-8]|uniref:acyl-CoA thioester hydrolase/BAAT C-terminal domain-containing protein n=1 Tax=Roseivirga sp. BDSF3-8 TaxID=3241598 RepID=UPI0035324E06